MDILQKKMLAMQGDFYEFESEQRKSGFGGWARLLGRRSAAGTTQTCRTSFED